MSPRDRVQHTLLYEIHGTCWYVKSPRSPAEMKPGMSYLLTSQGCYSGNADRGTIVLTAYKKLLYKTKALVHITGKLSCVVSEQPKYLGVANAILKYFPWHRPMKTYGFHISQYHRWNKVHSYKLVDHMQSSTSSTDICFICKRMHTSQYWHGQRKLS